jgi:2-(1,2-epoxy-1,2-dihydrophenyl)acetyl-CoA isomerase
MSSDEILLVEPGPITWITLNRPERHNALSTAMGDRLMEALTTAGRSPDVVLRGAGPSFCSGDDRTEGAGGRIDEFPWDNPYHSPHVEPFGVHRHGYFQLMGLIRRIPQPVIAQVHGYCMGSAVDLMLAADFAVVERNAKIKLVFGDRGIGPAGTVFLPRYVGLKRAMQLLFDSEYLSAEDALTLGLITAVADADDIDGEVMKLAERMLRLGKRSYGYFGLVKETVNRAIFSSLDEDVRMQVLMTRLGDFFRLAHPAEASSASP